MIRGDLITVAIQGDFGKPRPALVVQADQFEALGTLTVLPVSGTLIQAPLFRITIQPSAQNGLQKLSQVMADKTITIKRDKVGVVVGHLEAETMMEVERSLAVFLGIAK